MIEIMEVPVCFLNRSYKRDGLIVTLFLARALTLTCWLFNQLEIFKDRQIKQINFIFLSERFICLIFILFLRKSIFLFFFE